MTWFLEARLNLERSLNDSMLEVGKASIPKARELQCTTDNISIATSGHLRQKKPQGYSDRSNFIPEFDLSWSKSFHFESLTPHTAAPLG